jgi:hypothetical protein
MTTQLRIAILSAMFVSGVAALGPGAESSATGEAAQEKTSQESAPTIASAVDREISIVEKQVIEVAEAMPEEEYNFSPESLKIPGSDYKGVRTFAVEVKHVASSNYFLWAPVAGEKIPENIKDGNGPENLKSKADILKFLKDSFALGHKAAATLTVQNMLPTPANRPAAATTQKAKWMRRMVSAPERCYWPLYFTPEIGAIA